MATMHFADDPEYDERQFFHKREGAVVHTLREYPREKLGDYLRMASGAPVAYCSATLKGYLPVAPTSALRDGLTCRTCDRSYYAADDED